MGDMVSGLVDTVKGNAGLIGTGVGAAFGMPQVGAMIGGAIQGGASGGQFAQGGLGAYGNQMIGQANQQAQQAAAAGSQFKPVGITNTFGTSNFAFDPNTGQMTSAGYNLDPRLQGAQNTLMGGLGQNLQDTSNIQAMGRQYMAQSPQEAAQQWMGQQQALLQPSRDMAQAGLNNSMFNSGTGGLSVAQGGGMGMANPQQQALANAQALQNLTLAGQAQQQGQNQYTFGQGLLTSAYSPLLSNLGAAQSVEQLGQSTLDMGAQLGGRAATAGANVGQSLLQGGMSAAKIAQAGNAYSPMGSVISGAFSNPQMTSWLNNQSNSRSVATPQLSNEVSGLGSSTSNPWSDYNRGTNGWGNYGE